MFFFNIFLKKHLFIIKVLHHFYFASFLFRHSGITVICNKYTQIRMHSIKNCYFKWLCLFCTQCLSWLWLDSSTFDKSIDFRYFRECFCFGVKFCLVVVCCCSNSKRPYFILKLVFCFVVFSASTWSPLARSLLIQFAKNVILLSFDLFIFVLKSAFNCKNAFCSFTHSR